MHLAQLGRSLAFEREISPDDRMLEGDREQYYRWGLAALDYVHVALRAAEFEGQPRTVLDFACGHGRVARMLRAGFPDAAMTVCDINSDAVEFCARTFDATPVQGEALPEKTELHGRFALIWVGSLFSHLDAPRWDGFLRLLCDHLESGGVLVFTTLGRTIAAEIRSGRRRLAIAAPDSLAATFDERGFAYQDYVTAPGYGIALARPSWVCEVLQRFPELELVTYGERAWLGRQDAIACRQRPGERDRSAAVSSSESAQSSPPAGSDASAVAPGPAAGAGTDADEPPSEAAPAVGS
jgi:SAM-dependent methyltransferase